MIRRVARVSAGALYSPRAHKVMHRSSRASKACAPQSTRSTTQRACALGSHACPSSGNCRRTLSTRCVTNPRSTSSRWTTAPDCLSCADLRARLGQLGHRHGWQVRAISGQDAMLRSGRLGIPWVGHPVAWVRSISDPNRIVPIAIGTDLEPNLTRNLYLAAKMRHTRLVVVLPRPGGRSGRAGRVRDLLRDTGREICRRAACLVLIVKPG